VVRIYTIYCATNTINGRKYIGFDSNWPARKTAHKTKANAGEGAAFHHAIRKYGLNAFEWEILYQSYDKEHTLKVMEPHFITEMRKCKLYNLTDGGEGSHGAKATLETRQKMSASNKITKNLPEQKAIVRATHTGRKRSDATKEAMRLGWLKRKELYGYRKAI
jgi:group I intron endonuclease